MSEYNGYGLMDREISIYKGFCERHKTCNPKNREEIMEESAAPAYSDVILHMSTIGMFPQAKCLVCGTTESISCDERIESA